MNEVNVAVFKEILPSNVKTSRSFLNQLIDVLQEDVSASISRRKYQAFITGGLGPGVTSSLYQTVYDQDFTYQTANPVFDITFGLRPDGDIVATSQTGIDSSGKELFPSSSLMMREKMDCYRQYAKALLGDSTSVFSAPFDGTNAANEIDAALFISFKRLFSRDSIKRETFAMKFFQSASAVGPNAEQGPGSDGFIMNLNSTSTGGSAIYTDVGSSTNKLVAFGGQVGNIVDSADTNKNVGLMFYDRGIVVLDLEKITSGSQFMSGTIDAMTPNGIQILGAPYTETPNAKFIPDFVVSGSMDNVIDHICATRFSSGSNTAITFQNITNINSTLIFCNLDADEFNYSTNPTYTDSDNRIVVIDSGQEDVQTSFAYATGVGLYDAQNNLLAVAKLSRPIEKSSERNLTIRIRLDF
jgi:hypothetical protein